MRFIKCIFQFFLICFEFVLIIKPNPLARKKYNCGVANGSCERRMEKSGCDDGGGNEWWWWQLRHDEKCKTKFLPVRTSVNTFSAVCEKKRFLPYLQSFGVRKREAEKKPLKDPNEKLMLWGCLVCLWMFLLVMNSKRKENKRGQMQQQRQQPKSKSKQHKSRAGSEIIFGITNRKWGKISTDLKWRLLVHVSDR